LKTLQVHLKSLLEKEISFKKIDVINPKGLEEFYFLKDRELVKQVSPQLYRKLVDIEKGAFLEDDTEDMSY
jgi:hypothetical protein